MFRQGPYGGNNGGVRLPFSITGMEQGMSEYELKAVVDKGTVPFPRDIPHVGQMVQDSLHCVNRSFDEFCVRQGGNEGHSDVSLGHRLISWS